jgi:Centromere DNA-binding protein complex CBF3 subunit, domain 2
MLNLDADDADTQLETLNGLENVMAADAGVVLHDDDDDDELSEEEEEEPATAACPVYRTRDFPTLAAVFGLTSVQVPITKSSETTCRGIWPYWARFCHANSRVPIWSHPYGLNLYPPPPLPKEGDSDEIRLSRSNAYRSNLYKQRIIIDFFAFMAKQKAVNENVMSKAKTWMNACLGCEFTRRILDTNGIFNSSMETVTVGELREVKQHCLLVKKDKAKNDRETYKDQMATVGTRISDEQEEVMLLSVIDGPKAGGEVEQLSLSNRVNFAATYTVSRADGRRKNEHYRQRWIARFIQWVKTIGPCGMWINVNLTNDGKTNQYGHLEYTGMVITVNPVVCSSGWHGFSLFHRYTGLGSQKFPTGFLDYKTVMDIVTYASEKGGQFKHISKAYYGKIWDGFYKDAGVFVAKLTHQTRVQCEQELDDAGVDTGDISRLVGHITPTTKQSKAQLRSYLTNPPVRAMVQRAGGDHNNPQTHQPCRHAVDVSPALINLLFPELLETKCCVYQRIEECSSHEEMAEKRLYTLKHCIDGMVHDFGNFLRMLASRMIDPVTKALIPESPTIFEKFCHGPFHDLFQNPGFYSQEFLSLVSVVRAAEDRYYNLSFSSASSQGRMIETSFNEAAIRAQVQAQVQGHAIYMKDALTKMHSNNEFMMALPRLIANELRNVDTGSTSYATMSNGNVQEFRQGPPARVDFANPQERRILPRVSTSPTSSEYCKNGKKRVRARSVPQTRRLQEEREAGLQDDGVPRPMLNVDKHFKTFQEHLSLYENDWLQRERLYGARWRTDRVIPDEVDDDDDESHRAKKKRGPNARNSWYSLRRPLYEYVAEVMERKHITRDEAIKEASELYESVPKTKATNGPNIKVLCAKFKEKLNGLGWKPAKGRPKGKLYSASDDEEGDNEDITTPRPPRRRQRTNLQHLTAQLPEVEIRIQDLAAPPMPVGQVLQAEQVLPGTPGTRRRPFPPFTTWEEADAYHAWARRKREEDWRRARNSDGSEFAAAFSHIPIPPTTEHIPPPPPRIQPQRANGCYYYIPTGQSPPDFSVGAGRHNPLQRHGDPPPAWHTFRH